ncbi:MAG: alpha-L-fucosidase [Polyangia bacterium]|jgi:alpha-L-fucosidase
MTFRRNRIPREHEARIVALWAVPILLVSVTSSAQTLTMQQLLSNHIEQRFGMFIHYNMNTYYYGWAEDRVDPKTFAPPAGDCHTFTDQWATAAKSAGMKFGVLTTKHHDGFAIWPSKAVPPTTSPYGTVPYTIAQSAVPTMDVVKCYVDSFRAQGLDPDLYFSIWDPNNGIGSQAGHNTDPGPVDWNVVGTYITTQITELLTNYGDIPVFVFDGYAWLTGHQQIPYQKIRALVRQLQPNTIIIDHNGGVPWEVDVEYFEEPLGVTVPSGNVTAGAQGQTIAKDKNWFWRSTQAAAGYLSASSIANEIKGTESNYTNFILDCPPNLQGLLDDPVVTTLGQVPQYWTPNTARAPLPQQQPKIETPLTAVLATATSGTAALAIDGYNDSIKGVNNTLHSNKGESLWTPTGALPQSLTLNLGTSYDNIDMLEYLPQRHTGTTAGNITSYKVFVSTDNVTFTQVASGTWPADPTYHGLLCPQRAQFSAQTAQYVRLEADAVSGGGTSAIAGEIAVGSSGATGTTGDGGTGGSGGNSGTGGSGGIDGGGGGSTTRAGGAGGAGGAAGGGGTGGAAGHGGSGGTGASGAGGTAGGTPSIGGAGGASGGVAGSPASTGGRGGSGAAGAAGSSSASTDSGAGAGGAGTRAGSVVTPAAGTSAGGSSGTVETGAAAPGSSGGAPAGTAVTSDAAGGTTGTASAPDAGAGAHSPASPSGCSCALGGTSSSTPTSAWFLFNLAALLSTARRRLRRRR